MKVQLRKLVVLFLTLLVSLAACISELLQEDSTLISTVTSSTIFDLTSTAEFSSRRTMVASFATAQAAPVASRFILDQTTDTYFPPCFIYSGEYPFSTSTPDPKYPQGIKLQLDLHNGLILQEIIGVHPELFSKSGCRYLGRDDHTVRETEIDLGNSYHVFILPLDNREEEVTVSKNNIEIFKIIVHPYTFSGLLAAWSFQDHWALEITTLDGIDIIQDGKSQKSINGYVEVCSFQVLNGKPFYFFKKSNLGYGVNYDGVEIYLDYNKIPCNDANENVDPVISRFKNMVYFHAIRDGDWVNVIIGAFDK